MLCVAVIFMAAATPLSAWAGDRYGRRPVLLVAGSAALLSGFLLDPMLGSGSPWQITVFLSIELFLMGATFAPMGAVSYTHLDVYKRQYQSNQGKTKEQTNELFHDILLKLKLIKINTTDTVNYSANLAPYSKKSKP